MNSTYKIVAIHKGSKKNVALNYARVFSNHYRCINGDILHNMKRFSNEMKNLNIDQNTRVIA